MNEGLETARAVATEKILAALTAVVEDKEKSFPERLSAADMVRSFSQDLILADLSSRGLMQDGDFKKKLLNSADKLDRRGE